MTKILCIFLLVAGANCFYVENSESFKSRIARGYNDYISHVPYLAQLLKKDNTICGATIITEHWLLTAAHCTHGKNMTDLTIVTGATIKRRRLVESGGTKHKIVNIIEHLNYNKKTEANDIALIKIKNPIKFGKLQRNIPIANSSIDRLPKKQKLLLSGWGKNENNTSDIRLHSVQVPLFDFETCRDRYQKANIVITENMFCAGIGQGDSCKGDSGGPVVVNGRLVGIVSFGKGQCNNPYYPGIYTDVFNYRWWILVNTQSALVLQ